MAIKTAGSLQNIRVGLVNGNVPFYFFNFPHTQLILSLDANSRYTGIRPEPDVHHVTRAEDRAGSRVTTISTNQNRVESTTISYFHKVVITAMK